MKTSFYTPVAAGAGGLLATMILLNGMLGAHTNPFLASFIVHLVGSAAGLGIWAVLKGPGRGNLLAKGIPPWLYLGGVGGAFAVVTSNIAVNSRLGLAGSLSFFILGQTLTALAIDLAGLFGVEKKRLETRDGIRIAAILAGSLLIINSGSRP